MYTLIRERVASMYELSYVYNLDEMLKLQYRQDHTLELIG